ncbi:hypothetical protein [Saccharicrinis fermentans]|uniref:hypothetical protein n=1 Tax=Saccharicrinis fermentans TaxID=982 RepID=UPI001377EFA5|nr:hypothetical protein [Saccharicrinis fermentans]
MGYTVDAGSFDSAMPLWSFFSFVASIPWLAYLLSIVSCVVISLSINRLNSKYGLLSKQSALPGIVFVFLVGGLIRAQGFNPVWLIALFFVLAFEYLFEAHNYRRVAKECFLAAFWISTASLVSYKVVLIFPLIFIIMGILRLLNVKSFLAAIIGLLLPWLFLLGYELGFGSISNFFSYINFSWLKIFESNDHPLFMLGYLATIAFIFLIALFSVLGAYGVKKIYTRKLYQVFIFCGLYFVGMLGISGLNIEWVILVALPFSVLVAHLLDQIRSLVWQNVVITAMILIPIVGQILL